MGIEFLIIMEAKCQLKAERVGFEPTVVQRATTVFETAPINHSGTSPYGLELYQDFSTAR